MNNLTDDNDFQESKVRNKKETSLHFLTPCPSLGPIQQNFLEISTNILTLRLKNSLIKNIFNPNFKII